MSNQTEKLAAPLLVIPEAEHNAWENIHYKNQHLTAWLLSVMASNTRAYEGRIDTGQIKDLKVHYILADGTQALKSFPDTAIAVDNNRKIYYADYDTDTILSLNLADFADFTPDEKKFPVVHSVRYQTTPVTTADVLAWIAPKAEYSHQTPIGKIMALHPHAPVPNSIFWKYCDGTGTLGDNFPGHETDTVPQLTDDRFLMGASSFTTLTGGSNVLLDHTHGHSLTAAGQSHSGNSSSVGTESTTHTHSHNHASTASGNNTAGHTHNVAFGTMSGQGGSTATVLLNTTGGTGFTTSGVSANHAHYTDLANQASGTESANHNHVVSITHTHSSSSVSGSVGSGDAPSATDSRPKYFKTKFYLRIK